MMVQQNMMQLRTYIFILFLIPLFGAPAPVCAQQATPKKKDYQRAMFHFDSPSHLSISSSGTSITLHFDQPVSESADAIQSTLAGYATKAALSEDKKTVTLIMNKTYRIRQFVSGSSVGIDVVGQGEAVPEQASASTDASPPATTPEEKKPISAPAKEKTNATKKPNETILSTKKPEAEKIKKPRPSVIKQAETNQKTFAEKSLATPPASEEKNIYTTKPNLPIAAPASVADTDVPLSSSSPEKPAATAILTTKNPEPAKGKTTPTTTTKIEKSENNTATLHEKAVPSPEKSAEKQATSVDKKLPFTVTARTTTDGAEISFPWQERTAAAVFERGNDIWIIFSRPSNPNLTMLRNLLPPNIIGIHHYAYTGNTVLRLTTDGSLHPTISQSENTYGWNIAVGPIKTPAGLEVTVGVDGDSAHRHLLLSAFDVAPTLNFYDPRIGDWLTIIPTYENGRGMVVEKRFPELTLLATNQGIASASAREDLKTENTRVGLTLSAPDGLKISENLPMQTDGTAAKVPMAGIGSAGVLLPYRLWYVAPDQFKIIEHERLRAAYAASKNIRPDALMSLVALYLGQGMGTEAHGYLQMIEQNDPDYYKLHKLALLDAAAYFLMNRPDDAAKKIAAPELNDVAEAALWREALSLYTPKIGTIQREQQAVEGDSDAKKNAQKIAAENKVASGVAAANVTPPAIADPEAFHFLKFNKPYIQYYPPVIRQRLAILAADAYMSSDQEEKAVSTFDSLNRDGILKPVEAHAEFALGALAAKKKKTDEALKIFDRLAADPKEPYISARARYTAAMLRYSKGTLTAEKTVDEIEMARSNWRGDALEHQMLLNLANIYKDLKRYDETLRSWRTFLDVYPNDPDYVTIAGKMNTLFEDLFLNGLADEMPPVKALSLFYEFRDMTPLGDKGDEVIQKLADRLAKFDLLDRATQLLDHQIKFRVGGEKRSRIGAQMALLYLFNHQPKEALDALEATNYGENNPELKIQRQQLSADALSRLGRHEEALAMLFNDTTKTGILLRLDILWAMQDWPNVVNRAEDILSARPNLTAPLSQQETEVLLKLALAYNFQSDYTQLRYLRDYYSGLIPDTAYKQVFDYITNDTSPLDPEDFAMVAKQISHAESFLDTFRSKIATGKLSDTIK